MTLTLTLIIIMTLIMIMIMLDTRLPPVLHMTWLGSMLPPRQGSIFCRKLGNIRILKCKIFFSANKIFFLRESIEPWPQVRSQHSLLHQPQPRTRALAVAGHRRRHGNNTISGLAFHFRFYNRGQHRPPADQGEGREPGDLDHQGPDGQRHQLRHAERHPET